MVNGKISIFKKPNGEVHFPVTSADAVFMRDGHTTVREEIDSKANKNDVANGLTAKGNTIYSKLPTSNNKIGDFYYCTDGDGVNPAGNYVWNGTTWYFGGTGDDGYSKVIELIEYNNVGVNSGYIVYTSGKVSAYEGLNCSDYIEVLPNSKLLINLGEFNLNKADARGLAFYDINKSYVSGIQYQAGTPIPNIECSVPQNCYYFRLTYKDTPKLYITTPLNSIVKKFFEIKRNIVDEVNYTDLIKSNCYTGGYINNSTGTIGLYGDSMAYTNYIYCEEGDTLVLENISTYTDVRGIAFYDIEKNYISGHKYDSETLSLTVPNGAKFFAMTISDVFKETFSVKYFTKNSGALTIREVEFINPIEYKGNEISIFTRCCCVGDSLTRGVFNANNTGETEYVAIEKYGYPKRLHDLTGVECVNLGQGGHTTKSWYSLYENKDLVDYDMAIINLGANDTVGNSMTPELTEEYLQKIVNKLRASNNGIKIFIATILPAYYTRNTDLYGSINSKIKNVVNKNDNCYLIDLTLYSKCKNDTNYAEGHLTALGYNQEAKELKAIISHLIKNNMNDFKYVQFINSDYSFN